MNAFIRQLAVLAGLWALCGLLLPEGRQQQMVHLAVSLMVMTALVGSLQTLLYTVQGNDRAVLALRVQPAAVTGYDRIALASIASQAEALCVRTARKAGYEAAATVTLHNDGSLASAVLYLRRGQQPPLMEETALVEAVATLLAADGQQVCWLPADGEAMP